ncbi:MAG: hypothetical protein WCI31_11265 [Prolixibacteraceae bacterium]
MTIKTFWTILLKILGLWFLFVGLATIVQFSSIIFFASQSGNSPDIEKVLLAIGIVMLAAAIFVLILWLLIFKSAWIIEKLKLTKGFTEERLELTMEWSTILTIATIVVGGVIFSDSFPLIFKQTLAFIQHGKSLSNSQESIWILFYLVKTILGYLLMTNSRFVVNFIGRQNIKNGDSEIPTAS